MEAGFILGLCYCRLRVTCANKGVGRDFLWAFREIGANSSSFKTNCPHLLWASLLLSSHYLLSTPCSSALQERVGLAVSETSQWSYLCFLAYPQAHFKQTGEEPEWRWARGSPFPQRSRRFCSLFMRQAGQDRSDKSTSTIKPAFISQGRRKAWCKQNLANRRWQPFGSYDLLAKIDLLNLPQ